MKNSDGIFAANMTKKVSFLLISFLILLRITVGWHLLYEGLSKLFTPGWSAAEYLALSRWFFAPFFNWIAENAAVLNIVNFVNIWGLIAAGAALMLGLFSRIAGGVGAVLILLYYLSNPPLVGLDYGVPAEGSYLIVNKNFIELIVLILLTIVPTGKIFGLDRLLARFKEWKENNQISRGESSDAEDAFVPERFFTRREVLLAFGWLPFFLTFMWTLFKKSRWESYEEKNLVDAMTSASPRLFNLSTLKDLKGNIPYGKIKDTSISRIILGGNLLSGYSHSRDLIYVSELVRTYHHKDKIFATLYLAEQCGVNTLLTNPIMATMIDEYWRRKIGKIQFISDCAGLIYGKTIRPEPFDTYMDRIRRAIDYGACACYIQGETADYYMENGLADKLEIAMNLVRDNGILLGIGAHKLDTVKACVNAGYEPDFWMKTMHHHNYWSARHPEERDNKYCYDPEETAEFMKNIEQPWIAFKVMAAGAIHPENAFKYAFEMGADFICAGMYDFQIVQDINIAYDALNSEVKRDRQWRA